MLVTEIPLDTARALHAERSRRRASLRAAARFAGDSRQVTLNRSDQRRRWADIARRSGGLNRGGPAEPLDLPLERTQLLEQLRDLTAVARRLLGEPGDSLSRCRQRPLGSVGAFADGGEITLQPIVVTLERGAALAFGPQLASKAQGFLELSSEALAVSPLAFGIRRPFARPADGMDGMHSSFSGIDSTPTTISGRDEMILSARQWDLRMLPTLEVPLASMAPSVFAADGDALDRLGS